MKTSLARPEWVAPRADRPAVDPMTDPLASYAWRGVTPEQRAAAERLIAEGLAAPLPVAEQRARVDLDLRARRRDGHGDRWFIARDGTSRRGYTRRTAK